MTEAEWQDATLPEISLRASGGDGLTIRLRRMTTWSADYSGWAAGDVVTRAGGDEKRHENVLMGTDELGEFARFLRRALDEPRRDWTLSVFDDGMTLRITGDGPTLWRAYCRPVPVPGPGYSRGTFPAFGFTLTKSTMEEAISELAKLSSLLSTLQRRPLP